MRTIARACGRGLGWCVGASGLVAIVGWSVLAVYYSNLPWPAARAALGVAVVLGAGAALVWIRPWWRAVLSIFGGFALVLVWWLLIPPSNDRDWQADVTALPSARLDGFHLTVTNVRNNEYRSETDYTPRWETRTYDLDALRTTDLFIATWGAPLIAHTILSFGFTGDRYLAISIETRKVRGAEYSAVRGFFKQYELIYVVADERDVIRLRTNYRGEDVRLYRLATSRVLAREILLDYLTSINRLRDHPEWYNALTHNCTTAVRGHVVPHVKGLPWSWKILLNGRLDEHLYEIGAVRRDLTLGDLRERGYVNTRARSADGSPEFSRLIRTGVPAPPRSGEE
jgi:hypothetical protein